MEREPGTRGFRLLPRRWVVERSLAWLPRNRRLAKDYERKVQTSETLIELASSRLLIRRFVAHPTPRDPAIPRLSDPVSDWVREGGESRLQTL